MTKSTRARYTLEFKEEAIRLVTSESTKNRGRCSGSGAACTLKRSEIYR